MTIELDKHLLGELQAMAREEGVSVSRLVTSAVEGSGMSTANADLDFAHRLADTADTIALAHFAAGETGWRSKTDGSPFSIADEQIERALRTVIHQERPSDAVLGEEFGATGRGRRRWIIDAIDGTASFLAGEPEWSTLIALEEQGTIMLGLVSAATTPPNSSPSPERKASMRRASASGPRPRA